MIKRLIFSLSLFAAIHCDAQELCINKELVNSYLMTPELSDMLYVPSASFLIRYPSGIVVNFPKSEWDNENYIEFGIYKDKNRSKFLEGITIGHFWYSDYYKESGVPDSLFLKLLLDTEKHFQELFSDSNYKTVFIEERKLNGKLYYQFGCTFEVTGKNKLDSDLGKYKMLNVLVPPEGISENGVSLWFQATENSEIKTFDDFGVKGVTGQIWQSFRFAQSEEELAAWEREQNQQAAEGGQ